MSSAPSKQPAICFDACKKEQLLPTKGYKQLHRKLKQFCTVEVNKEQIAVEKLIPFELLIFGMPAERFSSGEFEAIKQYLNQGGSVLLTVGEGGRFAHLNEFLSEFGIALNEDCVVRTVLHKYFHPKEVCITNGITNREINRAAGKTVLGSVPAPTPNNAPKDQSPTAHDSSSLVFVYPYGLTMNVQRPGVPILSSGFMAYPLNRPVAAVWESPHPSDADGKKRGRLLVVGSGFVFEDTWIIKEENDALTTVLIDYLLGNVKLNQIDADDPEISDYNYLPDTASMADRLRVCVEESEDLPRDFTQLFDTTQFKFDTNMIPEVVATYSKLNMKYEALSLIHPEFQAPLPPRIPATFDPIKRDPPAPALDLFDLDEHFASEKVRLSQLTNKCQSEDLEFFILESAEIMGVTKKLRSPRNKDPRALLDYIFRQVLQYKKRDHEPLEPGTGGAAGAARNPPPSASAGALTRVMRIIGKDDGTCDITPFDRNAPWGLTLHVDFARGSVAGQLVLEKSSVTYPAQQCEVHGTVKADTPRPITWEVVLTNLLTEQVTFVFQATLQGSALNGQCEANGQSSSFVYQIEDSP